MASADPILDRKILALSQVDYVTTRSATEGTLITGAPGSGKSSCSGKQLAYRALETSRNGRPGAHRQSRGNTELDRLCEGLRPRERSHRLQRRSPAIASTRCITNGHGQGAARATSKASSISSPRSSPSARKKSGHGHDPFWERGNEQLMRNVIKLLDLAGERISIASIDRVIKSLPTRPGEYEEEALAERVLLRAAHRRPSARARTRSPPTSGAISTSPRNTSSTNGPRSMSARVSSLEMTWSGMADKFLFNPFNRLFCSGKCTFTPEMTTHEGKIIICDFPMLEYGHETGRLINIILKLIFQRAWLGASLRNRPTRSFSGRTNFSISSRDGTTSFSRPAGAAASRSSA